MIYKSLYQDICERRRYKNKVFNKTFLQFAITISIIRQI